MVLLATRSIQRIDWPESKVFAKLTREAVKNSPEYNESTADERNYDARLYDAGYNGGHWS